MGGLAVRCSAGLTSALRADCVNGIFCTHFAQGIMVTCRFTSQVYKSFFFFFLSVSGRTVCTSIHKE